MVMGKRINLPNELVWSVGRWGERQRAPEETEAAGSRQTDSQMGYGDSGYGDADGDGYGHSGASDASQ